MIGLIIEIIGWCATFFRALGLLAKKAFTIKILTSVGNLLWMVSGIMTLNYPLIASNAICLVIMLFEIVKTQINKRKNGKEKEN